MHLRPTFCPSTSSGELYHFFFLPSAAESCTTLHRLVRHCMSGIRQEKWFGGFSQTERNLGFHCRLK